MTQIQRIQMILGHPSVKTCFDCGFKYIPMNSITNHLCPNCQDDEIQGLSEEKEKVLEVVSFEAVEV